jgi:hypothetical protein
LTWNEDKKNLTSRSPLSKEKRGQGIKTFLTTVIKHFNYKITVCVLVAVLLLLKWKNKKLDFVLQHHSFSLRRRSWRMRLLNRIPGRIPQNAGRRKRC